MSTVQEKLRQLKEKNAHAVLGSGMVGIPFGKKAYRPPMYAMGSNVAGVMGTAIGAGVVLAILG